MEKPSTWTVEELARELRVTPGAARRLCRTRKVPGARRIGKRWLVLVSAYEEGFRGLAGRNGAPKPDPDLDEALERAWASA